MPYNRLFNASNRLQTTTALGNPDSDATLLFPKMEKPGIDFDFTKSLYKIGSNTYSTTSSIPGFAFSRNSVSLAEWSDGSWSSFAVNTPRITDKGLFVESSRTNSVRNNSMNGAVAGTPGTVPTNWSLLLNAGGAGMTTSIVGTGSEYGLPYIDVRAYGTPTSANEALLVIPDTVISASSGQSWIFSTFARFLMGSSTSQALDIVETGGVAASTTTTISITNTFTRFWALRTLTQVGTTTMRPSLKLSLAQNVPVDFTIRVYAPQAEQGLYPTSPILTTGSAVTRASDTFTVTGLSTYLNKSITIGIDIQRRSDALSVTGETYHRFLSLYDTSQNRYDLGHLMSNNTFCVLTYSNNILGTVSNLGTGNTSGTNKLSFLLNPTSKCSIGGATPASATNQVGPLTRPHSISVGSAIGSSHYNGYIARFAIFSKQATDDQLKMLSQSLVYG